MLFTWKGAENANSDLYLVSGPTGSARAPSLLRESRLANELVPKSRTNSGFPAKYKKLTISHEMKFCSPI